MNNTEELAVDCVKGAPAGDFVPLFDQVWVISLKRRPDRLNRFMGETRKFRWPFKAPQVYHAVDGDKVGVPKYWQTGGGSYGCLRSHMNILERAILDDVNSILVLEDDALLPDTFVEDFSAFWDNVPKDWQCLMLGGQHANSKPIPVAPGVVRAGDGGGIQRTHCYALRGHEVMKALYKVWANAAVHCDWVMGPCMAQFNTYAPDPFLVGQADGQSDISGQRNPNKFWRSPSGHEPVIVLHAPRDVMEALRKKGWHSGYTRDRATGIDVGLLELFNNPALPKSERNQKLKDWINMIQWEVVSMLDTAYCTLWHPSITAGMIRPLVKGPIVEITADSVENALQQLPNDITNNAAEPIEVVLLKCSRAVLDSLRDLGWHTGHWRDEITGMDNGLRKLFASTTNKYRLKVELTGIINTLHDEAMSIHGGVVALWHPELARELIDEKAFRVIEVDAQTEEDALRQWKQQTQRK
jgi:hypothetical protein